MSDQDRTPPDDVAGGGTYGAGSSAPDPGIGQQPTAWQQPAGWQQQPGAMPAPMPPATGGMGQPADLGPRFLARLVDFILLGVVNAIIGGVLVAGIMLGSDASVFGPLAAGQAPSYLANAVSSLLSAAISLGYFAVMESSRGQTLGKMLLKLETRGPSGSRPTMEEALKRNIFTAIPILGIIPFVGFISGLLSLVAVITIAVTINSNTATRRGWHDNFAGGTSVVRIG